MGDRSPRSLIMKIIIVFLITLASIDCLRMWKRVAKAKSI